MAGKTLHFSRQELYEQVWSEPMVSLAQKYGLSDVGLRKRCKKLNIPLPPQGYFLRSQKRQAEARPPLPPFAGNEMVEIKPTTNSFPPAFVDQDQYKEATARIDFENLPENRIEVSERLTSPHPLIERTKNIKTHTGSPRGGRAIDRSCRDAGLDINVSKEYLGRALRIMDALLKAFESRGFKVSISQKPYGNNNCVTTVSVLGVIHEIVLKETFKQVKYDPPKETKKGMSWPQYHPPYDYIPSGRFTLSISGYVGEGGQNSWSDGKKQKIENCLNDFIIGLIQASVIDRGRDLKRELEEKNRLEQARRRAEEERRREEEKKRVQNLISEAQSWKQSQLIREYVSAVQAKAIEKNGELRPGSELDKWMIWANQLADRLDPLAEPAKPGDSGTDSK